MRKKKKINLKKEYIQSWKYVKNLNYFIYFSVALFLFFALFGFFVPAPEVLQNTIMEFLQELIEKTSGMSHSELIGFLFFNNVSSSFFGMILGVLFGIFPLISLISNGYLLGFVSSLSVSSEGFSILWRLVPHGIFELPALFLSLSMGLKLGTVLFQKNKLESFKEYFKNSIRVFLLVVVPLLIIAAIIEGSLIIWA